MKKTFKTFAIMLLTALAFSSCVDVPAPYNLPDKSSNSGGGGGSTINEGTPVNCAQAAELAKALGDGATSSEIYTVTGYITEVVGNVSKNQQTFWMADTKSGGRVFEAYYANLPDGVTEFKAGTKVKITGKLLKFVNNSGNVIPEMKNPTVQLLADDSGDTPDEDAIDVSCVMAAQITGDLPYDTPSTETYAITGYITKVVGAVSKNQQTFWMADSKDGGDIFQAFYANLPEGVSEFVVGMKVKIIGKLYLFKKNEGGIAEMKNPTVVILENGDGGDTPPVEGTEINCAEAVQLTNALTDGGTSTETYSVTGYITSVPGSVSTKTGTPQQTFWMADTKDGGQVFEAYFANVPSGISAFTVGMKVKLTGKLLKYIDTKNNNAVVCEIKNGDVVILEDGGDTPVGDIIPVTCDEAVQLTNALADGGTSADTYAVTGYITETDGKVSRNQQVFWMADDMQGGKVFQAYWANLPSGVSVFTVGMKVTITGKLLKYIDKNNGNAVICEIKNADVVIHEQGDDGGQGGDGGDTPGPGGNDVTELVNGDFEEWVSDTEPVGWKPVSGASNATMSPNQDAKSGSYSCLVKAIASPNQRLATQEITLEEGSYTFSYFAKSSSAPFAKTKGGYVPVTITNNEYKVGSYKYGEFVNLNNNEWTLVTYDFTLSAKTIVCLLVMNPKSDTNSEYTAQDILVDDATLVKK